MLIVFTLIAALFYLAATALQWRVLKRAPNTRRQRIIWLGWAGFAAHTLSVYEVLHPPEGIFLGFFAVGSLIAWVVAAIVLLSSLRQAIDNLFIGVFPLAAVTALLSTLGLDPDAGRNFEAGIIAHILLSILAYSLLTVAVLQSVLVSMQHSALKHHHTRGIVASLPPLQTMECLLFEMIWAGVILLSAALLSGFIFVEDLFAQHLVHKTVLSILAWCLYVTLLAGHHLLGWRSTTATRWTLGGFSLLALAFFGSKFVLELLG
ncbi:MAG: cytochrome C assembly family protein [Pontibacterium sp.]